MHCLPSEQHDECMTRVLAAGLDPHVYYIQLGDRVRRYYPGDPSTHRYIEGVLVDIVLVRGVSHYRILGESYVWDGDVSPYHGTLSVPINGIPNEGGGYTCGVKRAKAEG